MQFVFSIANICHDIIEIWIKETVLETNFQIIAPPKRQMESSSPWLFE